MFSNPYKKGRGLRSAATVTYVEKLGGGTGCHDYFLTHCDEKLNRIHKKSRGKLRGKKQVSNEK